jgi:poly-gamma-glutamate synthesis protein (capsule biosynthesis protein)
MAVKLFLCGDVMTGRGIDQILPHPGDPRLFESHVRSAVEYVALAEQASGPVPRCVSFEYVWGDALARLEGARPDVRIVNLETAITTSREAWPDKAIHYRMHPANTPCLTVAGIDCCVLANNHVLDWGRRGLKETLVTLHAASLRTAGAGADESEAGAPAIIEAPSAGIRVLVVSVALPSSGVPRVWRATRERAGVNWVPDLSAGSVATIGRQIERVRQARDVVVLSIHWGGNWGYAISPQERQFAHELIERAGVDLVHGHSSHHPKGIEVHERRLILYGCGDLLNDYEGICGYGAFRPELGLMYFPMLDAGSGELCQLMMIPMRVGCLRLNTVKRDEGAWLAATLDRECQHLGTRVVIEPDEMLSLRWASATCGSAVRSV